MEIPFRNSNTSYYPAHNPRAMNTQISGKPLTKSQLAKHLGVSRTYITLICQGKRQPSQQFVNKAQTLAQTHVLPEDFTLALVGKGGLEPPRIAAHDPKSCR